VPDNISNPRSGPGLSAVPKVGRETTQTDPGWRARVEWFEGQARRRKGGVLRALRWLAFVPVASRVPTYAPSGLVAGPGRPCVDEPQGDFGRRGRLRTRRSRLIPDEIPVLGGLDDLAVVVLAVEIFFDGIPEDLLQEKLEELCIDQDAFRRDIDQVRRLTPAPVRRIIRRLPKLLMRRAQLISHSKIGPPGPIVDRQGGIVRVKVILIADVDKARQERRDEGCRRRLRPQLPGCTQTRRARRRWRVPRLAARHRQPARRSGQREREDAEIAATRIASTTLHDGRKVARAASCTAPITAKDICRRARSPRHRRGPTQGGSADPLKFAARTRWRSRSSRDDTRSHNCCGA